MRRPVLAPLLFVLLPAMPLAAQDPAERADSLYIEEVERGESPYKVLHAEPLYIDLIRDLGARKGEAEWNVGVGLTDRAGFDQYEFLVEYEFAPIDRLGLEVELPFLITSRGTGSEAVPASRLESLKLAAQRTVVVSERAQASLALGYIHQFLIRPFSEIGERSFFKGNLFNPFMVTAKRFGRQEHLLWYGGLRLEQRYGEGWGRLNFESNLNLHHMVTGTRNFVGLEVNTGLENGRFNATLRPQMRVSMADNLLVGVVTGIPVQRENERLSFFMRLIYEPGHRSPRGRTPGAPAHLRTH